MVRRGADGRKVRRSAKRLSCMHTPAREVRATRFPYRSVVCTVLQFVERARGRWSHGPLVCVMAKKREALEPEPEEEADPETVRPVLSRFISTLASELATR